MNGVLVLLGGVGCGELSGLDAEGGPAAAGEARVHAAVAGELKVMSGFVPLHLTAGDLIAAPNLVITTATTIDTTALTIGGATSPYFVTVGGNAVLFTNALFVQAPITVTGGAALLIAAADQVAVGANISVAGHGTAKGPGAQTSGSGVGGDGTAYVNGASRASAGGGGGGHRTYGGAGGGYLPFTTPGGGGAPYGSTPSAALVGGSSGGSGGDAYGANGSGGGGGGALQISSAVGISIGAVVINANGGGGNGGGNTFIGGGGGGAGGEILLEAPALSILGTLVANGGGGGGGGGGSGVGAPGAPGADGLIGTAPAAGGSGGAPQGSNGGSGGAAAGGPTAGNDWNSKGGGGGGSAGRIWLRYRSGNLPNTASAVISPAAGLDSTLP